MHWFDPKVKGIFWTNLYQVSAETSLQTVCKALPKAGCGSGFHLSHFFSDCLS
jgi:hypothetical protein